MAAFWWKDHSYLAAGIAFLIAGLLDLSIWLFSGHHADEEALFGILFLSFGLIFLYKYRHRKEARHTGIGLTIGTEEKKQ